MSSRMITIVGFITAVLGFISPNLPNDTPDWVRLIMGGLLAGVASVGGYTHKGKDPINKNPVQNITLPK